MADGEERPRIKLKPAPPRVKETSAPIEMRRGEILELAYGRLHAIHELADNTDGESDAHARQLLANMKLIEQHAKRAIELLTSLLDHEPRDAAEFWREEIKGKAR